MPSPHHVVLGTPLEGPWPAGSEVVYLAMGCFWGVERIFWRLPGVIVTAAGYMGGYTPNPTYEETCTGATAHAETVQVVYDPAVTSISALLKVFWRTTTRRRGTGRAATSARPTGRRSTGRRARAGGATALATQDAFQKVLRDNGFGAITTEIRSAADAGPFYLAEDYHQGYLHKNPAGYCNHGPNGMTCPVGIANLPAQQGIRPPSAWSSARARKPPMKPS